MCRYAIWIASTRRSCSAWSTTCPDDLFSRSHVKENATARLVGLPAAGRVRRAHCGDECRTALHHAGSSQVAAGLRGQHRDEQRQQARHDDVDCTARTQAGKGRVDEPLLGASPLTLSPARMRQALREGTTTRSRTAIRATQQAPIFRATWIPESRTSPLTDGFSRPEWQGRPPGRAGSCGPPGCPRSGDRQGYPWARREKHRFGSHHLSCNALDFGKIGLRVEFRNLECSMAKEDLGGFSTIMLS